MVIKGWIIPALLIQKQGLPVSIANVQKLYGSSEFSTAITKDCIISVVFTILGASIITSNIKKQLENNDGKEVKIPFTNNENINKNNVTEIIKGITDDIDAKEPERTNTNSSIQQNETQPNKDTKNQKDSNSNNMTKQNSTNEQTNTSTNNNTSNKTNTSNTSTNSTNTSNTVNSNTQKNNLNNSTNTSEDNNSE